MPTIEPMMSIAYARSGGMLFSNGPRGSASVAMSATTRPTIERQDQEVQVSGAVLGETEEELVRRVDLDVELEPVDEGHDGGEQEGERREARIGATAAEDDAEADAEEARDQQEVAEEADVLDVRRDPADEQQLDEQDRHARQEQANPVT